jgi:hypothetical protein
MPRDSWLKEYLKGLVNISQITMSKEAVMFQSFK